MINLFEQGKGIYFYNLSINPIFQPSFLQNDRKSQGLIAGLRVIFGIINQV